MRRRLSIAWRSCVGAMRGAGIEAVPGYAADIDSVLLTSSLSSLSMRIVASTLLASALLFGAAPLSSQSSRALPETFTALAVNINSANAAAGATNVDIRIERWSSDADRDRLLEILRQQKDNDRATQDLLRALQELPRVGSIRTPSSVGRDLHYARENPLEDGGRRS